MSDEVCFFACSKAELLITAGPTRIGTVIDSSKKMNDLYHIELEQRYTNNPSLTIQCHKSCVSSYTSHHYTKRYVKRKVEQECASSEPPRTRWWTDTSFNFKKQCFICGKICLTLDPKAPGSLAKDLPVQNS